MVFQIIYYLIDKYLRQCLMEQYIHILIIMRALHVYEVLWYSGKKYRWFVNEYYQTLRIVLKATPEAHRILTRCAYCGIYFLTASSNRGRKDIRCPFGCREKHKKEASKYRSTAYYQTRQGQIKRQIQNAKRYRKITESGLDFEKKEPPSEGKGSFVGYLRFIAFLVEGRYRKSEVFRGLLLEYFKKWKQHPLEYWLSLCNMTL